MLGSHFLKGLHRCATHADQAECGKALLHVGAAHDLCNLARDLLDHRRRRASGHEQLAP
ncbi:hypothetical protein D3C86_1878110 [compost metagenome]